MAMAKEGGGGEGVGEEGGSSVQEEGGGTSAEVTVAMEGGVCDAVHLLVLTLCRQRPSTKQTCFISNVKGIKTE